MRISVANLCSLIPATLPFKLVTAIALSVATGSVAAAPIDLITPSAWITPAATNGESARLAAVT